MRQLISYKNPFLASRNDAASQKQTAPRRKSNPTVLTTRPCIAKRCLVLKPALTDKGCIPVRPSSYQLRATHAIAMGTDDYPRGLHREAMHGLIDDRLLTGKLGGWESVPSDSAKATQQPLRRGGVKTARHRVSLHPAPQALPAYLIKFVNQLMRHGKKGVAIGLLADSLILFLRALEEKVRNQPLHREAMHRHAPLNNVPATLERRAGVPSFPFYLTSFPGTHFGEALAQNNNELGNLLGLPFSGVLSPYFTKMGLPSRSIASRCKKRGWQRGSQSIASRCQVVETTNRQLLNPLSSILGEHRFAMQEKQNAIASSAAKTGVEVRSHAASRSDAWASLRDAKGVIYFWPPIAKRCIKGWHREAMPMPLACHSRSSKAEASVLSYLSRAIANVEPSIEVRKKKIAGITRQIPRVVPRSRGERLAIRWIINSARERVRRRGKGLPECLAEELMDAYHKRGEPRQRRDSLHKAAESNRSFLRYRWW